MSTLESIRQKPILIISILGVALLLFILTAVDRPGELLTDNHTVAKVDGKKIEFNTFQKRVEERQNILQQQGQSNYDVAAIQESVLHEMILETLLDNEFNRLGLVVTDNELSKALLGETPHPYVQQMLYQYYGMTSAQDLYDYAYSRNGADVSPEMRQQAQAAFTDLEKRAEQMLLQAKFGTLFEGTLTANKLDAQDLFDANNSTSTIAFARQDFSALNNDEFKASEEAIKALYAQEKKKWPLTTPQRNISFIKVDIQPSQDDYASAQKEVEDALLALRANEGTLGVEGNTKFYVDRASAPLEDLAPNLADVVKDMAPDSVALVSPTPIMNKYTIVKMYGKSNNVVKMLVDEVIFANAASDSVMNLLNSGASVESLGDLVQTKNDGQEYNLRNPQLAAVKDKLIEAPRGKFFQLDGYPTIALRINSSEEAEIYDFAEITYDVLPSGATITKLNNDLRAYVNKNNNATTFSTSAMEAGYNVSEATVTPASLSVASIPDTRSLAKWAMNAKKGQVSDIFADERETYIMAAALNEIYDGDYLPVTAPEVKASLEQKVIANMKGEKLVADYAGKAKSVAEYAGLMKTTVDTAQVTFGRSYVARIGGGESKLLANVAVAKPGELVGPLALNQSVIAFEVISVDKPEGREFDFKQDAENFRQQQIRRLNAQDILLGKNKVKYRIQRFYGDR